MLQFAGDQPKFATNSFFKELRETAYALKAGID